jgi:transcriptional regulator with XRE-family HTH domain
MTTIGERLKELRKQFDWTQKDVAEKLMVTRSAYAQYETDTKTPTVDTLRKLAELYKTSVDYIIGRY